MFRRLCRTRNNSQLRTRQCCCHIARNAATAQMKHVDGVFCMDIIGVASLLHTSHSQLVTADLAVAFGPLPTAGTRVAVLAKPRLKKHVRPFIAEPNLHGIAFDVPGVGTIAAPVIIQQLSPPQKTSIWASWRSAPGLPRGRGRPPAQSSSDCACSLWCQGIPPKTRLHSLN